MLSEHPLWRALLEALPYAVYVFDASGLCSQCSDPMAASSAAGVRLAELTHPAFGGELRAAIEATLADRAPRQAAPTVKTESGAERYFDARIQPVQGGGCLVLCREITAMVREERAIKDERELLRSVLDNDPSLIFIKDRQNRFVLVNKAFAAQYDASPEELMEVHNARVNPNALELEVYERIDREVLSTGKTIDLEESATRPSGEVLWFHTRKCPLRREDGDVHVLGISMDITAQRRALEDLTEQHRQVLELSAPLFEVWDRVLAVPVLGTLTADRSAKVMESLLAAVSSRGATHVIIDLTGARTVDVESADLLARMSRAIRLLGAEAVLAGLRPDLAAAVVEHGIELGGIPTYSNLRQALQRCIAARRGGR